MVFAEDILVRVGVTCVAIAVLSLLAVAATLILKLFDFTTPGWFSVALGLLVLILFQTGALTLITLMLTGLVKGIHPPINYREFVADVLTPRQS